MATFSWLNDGTGWEAWKAGNNQKQIWEAGFGATSQSQDMMRKRSVVAVVDGELPENDCVRLLVQDA